MELPLRYLLMGPPKSGKTWQSSTTPPPRLMIDLEGRARYTPSGKDAIFWDGEEDPMKLEKSKSRTYILETGEIPVLDTARQWLRTGKHPFKSISVDSIMEWKFILERYMYPGVMDLDPKTKGVINKHFEDALRDIRDLAQAPQSPVRCIMFITGASVDPFQGHIKPIMQGRVGEAVPYWMDLVGYQETITQKNSKLVFRELHLAQRPSNDLEVGDGTNKIISSLGTPIKDATVELLYETLQGKE